LLLEVSGEIRHSVLQVGGSGDADFLRGNNVRDGSGYDEEGQESAPGQQGSVHPR
jgi:hypothetical protein